MTTATSRPPRPGEVHGTSSQHRVLCAMFTLFVASHAPSRLTALLPNYSRLVTGVDYFFVGREEFERMIHDDELVEHAMVYGEHKGIPKSQIAQQIARGGDVVLRLDVQGAATVRKMLPQAVSVFITAESEAALAQRLVGRKTEPPSRLLERVATARGELTHMDEFDYVVCNSAGQMERTVHELCAIIDTEKLRLRERSYDL